MTSQATPVIGVTTHTIAAGVRPPRLGQNRAYLDALEQAGAVPVLLPILADPSGLRPVYDRIDGLLLPGGEDLDPARYGEPRHEACGPVSSELDETELALTHWAVAGGKPLFAICRGIQVLNVALGGTLYWDIPAELPAAHVHDPGGLLPLDHFAHEVTVSPGTRLAAILGESHLPTNSRHHQAVRDLGQGLVATAFSEDGIVEAIEAPDRAFLLSVQWHPENLCQESPVMRRLFEALVEAALQHHQAQQVAS
jgi:putative glutamine amidotransferase